MRVRIRTLFCRLRVQSLPTFSHSVLADSGENRVMAEIVPGCVVLTRDKCDREKLWKFDDKPNGSPTGPAIPKFSKDFLGSNVSPRSLSTPAKAPAVFVDQGAETYAFSANSIASGSLPSTAEVMIRP